MNTIHPTAIIDKTAELLDNVEVGPYCIIGPKVKIGTGTKLIANVVVDKWTTIGADCVIYPGAVIGADPQDLKYKGEETYLTIGDRTTIRECVTINRATIKADRYTRIGSDVLIMAYAHIAHDCQVHNQVVMANAATLAGHITIEEGAIIGGISPIHQFIQIGKYAIVGGASAIRQDVLPFTLVAGNPAAPHGLNLIGLKRRGFNQEQISNLKKAYKIIYRQGLTLEKAVETLLTEFPEEENIRHIIEFIKRSKRSISR